MAVCHSAQNAPILVGCLWFEAPALRTPAPISFPFVPENALSLPSIQQVLLAWAPAGVVVVLLATIIGGDGGLFARQNLMGQVARSQADLAALNLANSHIVRELRLLSTERVAWERAVAEDFGWAVPGATLVRFDEPQTNTGALASNR